MSNLLNVNTARNIVSPMNLQTYNALPAKQRQFNEHGYFAVINGEWRKVRLIRNPVK